MRSPNSRIDPRGVPLGLMRRYLSAHGWRRQPDTRARPIALPEGYERIRQQLIEGRTDARRNFETYVLSGDGVEDVEIILPRDGNTPDYRSRMETAIGALSDLAERSPDEIIVDVRAVGFDVVRSRIPDELVRNETIHLLTAAEYIGGVKSLLAATATTEMEPTPYFLRMKKEAIDYADGCQFGHTYRGSFGFTIESPVSPNSAPALFDIQQPPPFERRVIQRLARGIGHIVEAVRRDDVGILTGDVSTGLNANAYEQFADLVDETARTGMTFSFSFSPEWPPEADLPVRADLQVGPRHVEITRDAARSLRTAPTTRAEILFGRIVRLQTEADPSDLITVAESREAVIQWSAEDLGDIQVRVLLTPADYLVAIEAHRTGRPVRIAGTLEKRGRRWVLSNPSGITIPTER
jgi:hypothetical protein